jgi:hypothetical protein
MATVFDKLLLISLIILAVAGFFFARELFPLGSLVEISLDNKPLYALPKTANRNVTVMGPLGKSVVEINKGKVRMKSSPCPDQICVHQGWIERGTIICLPNKIIITVGRDEKLYRNSGVDAVTR